MMKKENSKKDFLRKGPVPGTGKHAKGGYSFRHARRTQIQRLYDIPEYKEYNRRGTRLINNDPDADFQHVEKNWKRFRLHQWKER